MRILHTSDWHLGKSLEGFIRLEEQERFIDELVELVEDRDIQLILIAGDIYDTPNPPAQAEKLFYRAMRRLSHGGERAIIVIAGNHDNPDRLVAANPLAEGLGVFLLGKPKASVERGKYGGVEVVNSGEGFIELAIGEERAVIVTLPYPSEKRLNEVIAFDHDEEKARKSYSEKVGELFRNLETHYREDTVNLAVSHLFVMGCEESESERPIQLGGTLTVDVGSLPNAQYIALGHLHKPQKVIGSKVPAYYCGSPLQYSKKERHDKYLHVIELKAGEDAKLEQIKLNNHKPIKVLKVNGIAEALSQVEALKSEPCWLYLEIETDKVLSNAELKQLKELRGDIVEIRPQLVIAEGSDEVYEDYQEMAMEEIFKHFYKFQRGVEPSEELLEVFYKICREGEEDEAKVSEVKGSE